MLTYWVCWTSGTTAVLESCRVLIMKSYTYNFSLCFTYANLSIRHTAIANDMQKQTQ